MAIRNEGSGRKQSIEHQKGGSNESYQVRRGAKEDLRGIEMAQARTGDGVCAQKMGESENDAGTVREKGRSKTDKSRPLYGDENAQGKILIR